MTEPYSYDDDSNDDDGNEQVVRLKRSAIRKLEEDAKRAREADKRAAAAERKLAFTEAGVTGLTEKQQLALDALLDGKYDNAETVKATAAELGFIKPEPDGAPDPERQQLEQMAAASSGAADPDSEDSVARIRRASREGGKEAVLAQLRADGSLAG